MLELKSYEKHKDSGVAWLGKVPEHWEVVRLGSQFLERKEKVSDKDYPPLSVTKMGILPQLETAAKTNDGDNRKKVVQGDFVINSRSDIKGSSGISHYTGSVSLINTVLIPISMYPRYIHNLFRSHSFQEEFYRVGRGIHADLWSTKYSEMSTILIPVPPLPEQQQIARYLDWQTAKINKFIRNKKKLIALLKEQKQNIINEAVTKGINPNVKMKYSGVEWLGEIPEHWEVRKIKHLCRFYSGGTPSKTVEKYWNGDIPWVSPKDMKSKFIFDAADHISHEAVSNSATSYIDENNILMVVRSGILQRTIPVGITKKSVTFNQDIRAVVPNKNIISTTYLYELIFGCEKKLLDIWRKVGATVESIEYQFMSNTYLPVPPLSEQTSIVNFISKESYLIDQALYRAEKEISLIQEYRTRLVSDVVTGKLDVRSVEIPDFEQVEFDAEESDEEVNEENDIFEGDEE